MHHFGGNAGGGIEAWRRQGEDDRGANHDLVVVPTSGVCVVERPRCQRGRGRPRLIGTEKHPGQHLMGMHGGQLASCSFEEVDEASGRDFVEPWDGGEIPVDR